MSQTLRCVVELAPGPKHETQTPNPKPRTRRCVVELAPGGVLRLACGEGGSVEAECWVEDLERGAEVF